ncbi:cuticle protein 18.6-like isoform X2 [Pectinophora gossypiella]|uniref:cuticle protein 18.6-like isoform X2 n=1 Tax=Pectinophora gossypiella TaxID=13191 RepID=UPI00214F5A04|nr:cuticle protein 18.6-like isoform X2 [Pectinophora gossypiella]
MRFLIAAAVLACAAAAPSGLLAAPYAHGLIGHGAPLAVAHAAPVAIAHAAPLAVAAPTISPGDIQGAAIDAHVEAHDHARAAVDAAREHHDQASELQGQAINAAEDHSWQAVDAVKTREAQLDGAAAGAAPILAKQLAGHAVVAHAAPVAAYAAPLAHAAYAAPVAHAAYAAPLAASKTVVSQSLHQSHPAPVYAAPVVHAAPALAYGAHGLAHGW